MGESGAIRRGRIFISYRREDTAYPAGWLFDRLKDHFGEGQIFKDVDAIELGDDFAEVITSAVASCDVLLALIGDRWLTITDEEGRRRLDQPGDFVRLEIEAALARNVRVIPILVGGTRMPRSDELPATLTRLARRHALELSPNRFEFDTRRLLKVLHKTLVDVTGDSPGPEPVVVTPEIETGANTVNKGPSRNDGQPAVADPEAPRPSQSLLSRTSRPVLVGVSAFAVVLLALGLSLLLSRDGYDASTVEVVVDGTAFWTDTGVDVAAGDNVEIAARGEVFHNEGSSIGPEGFPNRPDLLTPVDTANHAGLLGRVGPTGAPFYVGAGTTFTVDHEGRLFLGINDGGLENNRGSFAASVTVTSD